MNRSIARLMCWVMLFGWMAGAANACILQVPAAITAAHGAVHEHAPGEAVLHHHHDGAGDAQDGHDQSGAATPVRQACKSLCDSGQDATTKTSAGNVLEVLLAAVAVTGPCVILPPSVATRLPLPDAGVLPAPPPIPIAFLRLTI